jgi:hypothetical protein
MGVLLVICPSPPRLLMQDGSLTDELERRAAAGQKLSTAEVLHVFSQVGPAVNRAALWQKGALCISRLKLLSQVQQADRGCSLGKAGNSFVLV